VKVTEQHYHILNPATSQPAETEQPSLNPKSDFTEYSKTEQPPLNPESDSSDKTESIKSTFDQYDSSEIFSSDLIDEEQLDSNHLSYSTSTDSSNSWGPVPKAFPPITTFPNGYSSYSTTTSDEPPIPNTENSKQFISKQLHRSSSDPRINREHQILKDMYYSQLSRSMSDPNIDGYSQRHKTVFSRYAQRLISDDR
jgi:hypothetical protein